MDQVFDSFPMTPELRQQLQQIVKEGTLPAAAQAARVMMQWGRGGR
jgi:hypothetical protein